MYMYDVIWIHGYLCHLPRELGIMHVVAGALNPNRYWLNSKGMWAGYLTAVAILHYSLLGMPFLTTAMAWTLTHVIHNVVSILPSHFIAIL